MSIIKFNGVDVSDLVSVSYGVKNIESPESEDDLAGNTHTDIVRQKTVLNCTCGILTAEKMAILLQAIDQKGLGGVEVDVYYPQPKLGINVTSGFKVTSQSELTLIDRGNGNEWSGAAFTLIELGGEG